MKNLTNTSEKRIIVAFHTGRGGRYNNSGFTEFIGEKNFQDLISLNSNELCFQNRDQKGRFCKPHYTNINGDIIVESSQFDALTGCLDFDGKYDIDSCDYIDSCTEEEIEIVNKSSEYKSTELQVWLDNHNREYIIDENGKTISKEIQE